MHVVEMPQWRGIIANAPDSTCKEQGSDIVYSLLLEVSTSRVAVPSLLCRTGFPVVRFPPMPGRGKDGRDGREGAKDGSKDKDDDNGDDDEEDSLPEAKELLREMGMSKLHWAVGGGAG